MEQVRKLNVEELEDRIAPARAVLMDLPTFWALQQDTACKLNTALNDGDTSNDKLALKFQKKLDKITNKLTKFESNGKLSSHKITMLGHKLTHLAGKVDARLDVVCPPPDGGYVDPGNVVPGNVNPGVGDVAVPIVGAGLEANQIG